MNVGIVTAAVGWDVFKVAKLADLKVGHNSLCHCQAVLWQCLMCLLVLMRTIIVKAAVGWNTLLNDLKAGQSCISVSDLVFLWSRDDVEMWAEQS